MRHTGIYSAHLASKLAKSVIGFTIYFVKENKQDYQKRGVDAEFKILENVAKVKSYGPKILINSNEGENLHISSGFLLIKFVSDFLQLF